MATVGVYKLDDGENYPSNCFPVRSFFQQNKEGAGHWLVTHRNAVEQKYRRLKSKKTEGKHNQKEQPAVSNSTKIQNSSNIGGDILDRCLLMTLHSVDKPSELCSVDISEQKLHSAKAEDLEEFDNVAYINASDNSLTLEPFSRFPVLRELELSLNGLCNLDVNAGGFPHLEMLDLSYNNLSSEDILSIGQLPCLKVLHLTGNRLQTLPANMVVPHHSSRSAFAQDEPFCVLEVLMLDDNQLSSPGTFTSLANLKRLQHLNLQGNCITGVPYLQQRDIENLPIFSEPHSDVLALGKDPVLSPETRATKEKSVENMDYPNCRCTQQEQVESDIKQCSLEMCSPPQMMDRGEFTAELHLPLPELRFLNLANNKIAAEEALLAVALFPSLSELVIHSNPLTTEKSGDPPMLTTFLQDRLGIKINRKKTKSVKPHIVLPVNPKRKIKSHIPKVPKVPLFLEASGDVSPEGHASPVENNAKDFNKTPFPPERKALQPSDFSSQTSTVKTETAKVSVAGNGIAALEKEGTNTSDLNNQNGETFMTQVDYLNESEAYEKSEEKEPEKKDLVPKKFRGYEILLDAKPDPEMFLPAGIQQTVRVLEQALKNLLIYRDSKANLDQLQKPYTEKDKRRTKLPETKPRKLKREKIEDFLIQMKDRKTLNEVPLDKVLKDKDIYKKEYEEALTLLRDMKKKYEIVHMKALAQASHIECSEYSNYGEKTPDQIQKKII